MEESKKPVVSTSHRGIFVGIATNGPGKCARVSPAVTELTLKGLIGAVADGALEPYRAMSASIDVLTGRAKLLTREELPSDDELAEVHRELGELVEELWVE